MLSLQETWKKARACSTWPFLISSTPAIGSRWFSNTVSLLYKIILDCVFIDGLLFLTDVVVTLSVVIVSCQGKSEALQVSLVAKLNQFIQPPGRRDLRRRCQGRDGQHCTKPEEREVLKKFPWLSNHICVKISKVIIKNPNCFKIDKKNTPQLKSRLLPWQEHATKEKFFFKKTTGGDQWSPIIAFKNLEACESHVVLLGKETTEAQIVVQFCTPWNNNWLKW